MGLGPATTEQDSVAACSALIASGQETSEGLELVYSGRAGAYSRLGDTQRAIADYSEVIRLNPRDDGAYSLRGRLFSDLGDMQRAIADYSEAIRINPQDHSHYLNRGNVFFGQGDKQRAIADYSEAIRLRPQNAYTYISRARARARGMIDLDLALEDANKAIDLRDDAAIRNTRGFVHLRRGEFAEALADYDAALAEDPNLTGSLYARGIVKLRLGRTAEGQADIAAATKSDPGVAARYAGYGVRP